MNDNDANAELVPLLSAHVRGSTGFLMISLDGQEWRKVEILSLQAQMLISLKGIVSHRVGYLEACEDFERTLTRPETEGDASSYSHPYTAGTLAMRLSLMPPDAPVIVEFCDGLTPNRLKRVDLLALEEWMEDGRLERLPDGKQAVLLDVCTPETDDVPNQAVHIGYGVYVTPDGHPGAVFHSQDGLTTKRLSHQISHKQIDFLREFMRRLSVPSNDKFGSDRK